MIVYVTEQGAVVSLTRARLEIRKSKKKLESVRVDEIEQLVLCGQIQVTTQAIRALLRHGGETAFLTQSGRFLGRLVRSTGKNIELRRVQLRKLDDPEFVLDLARRIVTGKLQNQRGLLLRYQSRRPHERVAQSLVALRLLTERVEHAPDLDTLRGLEGRGAVEHFAGLSALITAPGIEFTKRLRRPPPDPVNILLSFGYTLLGNFVQGCCELASLDPHMGALHATDYGRPSLALDLIEEMRPVIVDTTVLRAINTKTIRPTDFVPVDAEETPAEDKWIQDQIETTQGQAPIEESRRLLLTPDGSRKWFATYERRLNEQTYYPYQGRRLTYRQILREQVYRMARHLREEEPYEPFVPCK